MAGRNTEEVMVMAGNDTPSISYMLSSKGRQYNAALFYVQVSPLWSK